MSYRTRRRRRYTWEPRFDLPPAAPLHKPDDGPPPPSPPKRYPMVEAWLRARRDADEHEPTVQLARGLAARGRLL